MSSSSRKRIATSGVYFTNAVYFPNHKIYSGFTPGMMNYSCISHVFYGFASVAMDGSIFLSDEWADTQAPCDGVQGGLGSLMHLKQAHPHLRVVLSVGGSGAGGTFPMVAANALLRDNFARSAKGLVEASGLDGIDIYWEYPSDPQQGADFVALLDAVRQWLPDDQFIVTAALPADRSLLSCIDLRAATCYLDSVNLMAYDFYGPWTHRSGHHAQLYSMSSSSSSSKGGADDSPSAAGAVAHLVSRGCPASRINLGIPLPGRDGARHRPKGVGGGEDGSGAFEYHQLPRRGAKEVTDKRVGAASCVGGDGGFVSYDNPDTVKMKARFCKQKGLGGLFYWTGPADAQDTSRSLVAAGFRALHTS
ncbi:glycoside hydrolase superfamily [Apiospora marii]|uniref:glycoside hydrolase superfamily n=1 Tax=Apiospora marii TaxID=335849 RepID=UPI00313207F1